VLDEALFAERALRAGAKGYVMKQAPQRRSWSNSPVCGGTLFKRKMQERMLENLASGSPSGSAPGVECLSDRELQVFQLVGWGCGTRQIAEQLRLSIKNDRTYRAHIKEKLKLRNGMELIRSAMKTASEQQHF